MRLNDHHSIREYTFPFFDVRTNGMREEVVWVLRCDLTKGRVHMYKKDQFPFCPYCRDQIRKIEL
jgi:hypothetical protein